jgi:hypothetical protein
MMVHDYAYTHTQKRAHTSHKLTCSVQYGEGQHTNHQHAVGESHRCTVNSKKEAGAAPRKRCTPSSPPLTMRAESPVAAMAVTALWCASLMV